MVEPEPTLDASRPSALRLAGFLGVATGGLLLGIGSLLNWAVIGVATSSVFDSGIRGTDVWEGRVTLAAGVLVLIGLIAMRLVASPGVRRAIAIAITLIGLFAAGLAAGDAIRLRSRFAGGGPALEKLARALATSLGRPVADILAEMQRRLGQVVSIKSDVGLWLVIAGGILAAVGGALSIAWANRRRSSTQDEPSPASSAG